MHKYLLSFFIAFFAVFLFLPKLSFAATDLIINEIMYDLPGTDANHEWVELYNAGPQDIDLTDYKFNDGSNHILNPPPQNASRGSLIIPAGGYLLLTGNASTTILDLPNYAGSIIDTVMGLNNTSDILKILGKDGQEIASASYTNEMGGAGNGKTLSWDGGAFRESAQDGGSPGEMNTFLAQEPPAPPPPPTQEEQTQTPAPEPTPSPIEPAQAPAIPPQSPYKNSSDKIFINEFLPWPADGKEWVELINTDAETIDLSGWQIDDGPEGSSPYKIPEATLITPNQYLVIKLNKNILNNDSDTVRLLWPDGQVVHSVTYQDAKQGFSSSRFETGLWLWTENLTPGQENKESTPKVQAPAEPKNQTSQQNETLAEAQNQTQQNSLPPIAQTAITQTPPTEQPKINPLVEATKENTAQKKSPQPTDKAVSPENKTPDASNLQAAIASPLQNQTASGRAETSNPKILLSFGAVLILSLAAGLGLIYFKRKKSVDGKIKPS